MARILILEPSAKVNLTLQVGPRRPDGFHDVTTLLQSITLHDTLTLSARRGAFGLACRTPGVPADRSNLVWKAAEALRRAFGVTAGATMRLTKRIPHEAGLGGGSSDAAAAIAGLNAVWGLNRSVGELLPVAHRGRGR